jgi:hypothetical protein
VAFFGPRLPQFDFPYPSGFPFEPPFPSRFVVPPVLERPRPKLFDERSSRRITETFVEEYRRVTDEFTGREFQPLGFQGR